MKHGINTEKAKNRRQQREQRKLLCPFSVPVLPPVLFLSSVLNPCPIRGYLGEPEIGSPPKTTR